MTPKHMSNKVAAEENCFSGRIRESSKFKGFLLSSRAVFSFVCTLKTLNQLRLLAGRVGNPEP